MSCVCDVGSKPASNSIGWLLAVLGGGESVTRCYGIIAAVNNKLCTILSHENVGHRLSGQHLVPVPGYLGVNGGWMVAVLGSQPSLPSTGHAAKKKAIRPPIIISNDQNLSGFAVGWWCCCCCCPAKRRGWALGGGIDVSICLSPIKEGNALQTLLSGKQ